MGAGSLWHKTARGHPALLSEETEEKFPEKVKYIWCFPSPQPSNGVISHLLRVQKRLLVFVCPSEQPTLYGRQSYFRGLLTESASGSPLLGAGRVWDLQHVWSENQEHSWQGGTQQVSAWHVPETLVLTGVVLWDAKNYWCYICKIKSWATRAGEKGWTNTVIIFLLLGLTWSHRNSCLIYITSGLFLHAFSLPSTYSWKSCWWLDGVTSHYLTATGGHLHCFLLCHAVLWSRVTAWQQELLDSTLGILDEHHRRWSPVSVL